MWNRVAFGVAAVAMLITVPRHLMAQVDGLPLVNNPRGGTGFSFGGFIGIPNADGGEGSTVAGTAAVGFGPVSFAAVGGIRAPGNNSDSYGVYGATAAFRLFGGGVWPIAINIQGGVGLESNDELGGNRNVRNYTMAVGFGLHLAAPGVALDPWISGSVRVVNFDSDALETSSNFGVSGGVDIMLPVGFGIRTAADFSNVDLNPSDGGTVPTISQDVAIFAVGLVWNFRFPAPM